MKLITTRGQIRTVAQRWREAYRAEVEGRKESEYFDKAKAHRQLAALDPETATADQITAIIGNSSWTSLKCDDCDQSVGTVVQLGQEPDYESSTANVCTDCLRKAVALVDAETIGGE